MKRSINLFAAAVIFLPREITAHAGKPVHENGIPFGNGFTGVYHYSLNIPDRHGNFACPAPEYRL